MVYDQYTLIRGFGDDALYKFTFYITLYSLLTNSSRILSFYLFEN